MTDSRQFVESFNRGFKLLKIVCESESPLSLSELAKECNLSISTIQRLTYTLQHLGLLDRDLRTKKFKIGPEMITLAFSVVDKLTLTNAAYPHMLHLSEQIDEVVGLGILSGSQVIFIKFIETQQLLNVNTTSGVSFPAHCTASGKAIFAFLPDSEVEALLKKLSFQIFTKNTITTMKDLKALLPEVRELGFAIAIDESANGLGAIAAPIRGNDGGILAALTIMVPTARVSSEELVSRYRMKVVQTADRISMDLGYRRKGNT